MFYDRGPALVFRVQGIGRIIERSLEITRRHLPDENCFKSRFIVSDILFRGLHTSMHACIHTYMLAYIHTDIHLYISPVSLYLSVYLSLSIYIFVKCIRTYWSTYPWSLRVKPNLPFIWRSGHPKPLQLACPKRALELVRQKRPSKKKKPTARI